MSLPYEHSPHDDCAPFDVDYDSQPGAGAAQSSVVLERARSGAQQRRHYAFARFTVVIHLVQRMTRKNEPPLPCSFLDQLQRVGAFRRVYRPCMHIDYWSIVLFGQLAFHVNHDGKRDSDGSIVVAPTAIGIPDLFPVRPTASRHNPPITFDLREYFGGNRLES